MTDKQKKQRTPKGLTIDQVASVIYQLPLKDKVTILNELKQHLEEEKKTLQQQVELISGSAK